MRLLRADNGVQESFRIWTFSQWFPNMGVWRTCKNEESWTASLGILIQWVIFSRLVLGSSNPSLQPHGEWAGKPAGQQNVRGLCFGKSLWFLVIDWFIQNSRVSVSTTNHCHTSHSNETENKKYGLNLFSGKCNRVCSPSTVAFFSLISKEQK